VSDEWHVDEETSVTLAMIGSYLFFPASRKNAYLRAIRVSDRRAKGAGLSRTNQLDVDTSSNIYSLGVLLYELVTGTTPLDHKRAKRAALLELLRVIRKRSPPNRAHG
jgi:serine/threonine protein kinase